MINQIAAPTHPEYERLSERANFANLYRSGNVVDVVETQARKFQNTNPQVTPGTPPNFHLIRRSQGETLDTYAERALISRYPRHFGRIVSSFVGSLFQVEDKAVRMWPDGEGIGDVQDRDSLAYEYWQNADGQGTNWPMLLMKAAGNLLTTHRQWYVVETDGEGEPARVKLLPQKRVINWMRRNNRLTEVMVAEHVSERMSVLDDEPASSVQFVRYTLDGWQRYVDDEGSLVPIGPMQEYAFPFFRTPQRAARRLPVGFVDLPMNEHVGYRAAVDNRYLYNMLSDIRYAMRICSWAKLTPTEFMDENQHELAAQKLAEGHNFLTFPGRFIGPPSETFERAYGIYANEVSDFYVTTLQNYEDQAAQRTATEIRQEQQGGRWSLLTALSASMDEMENDWWFLISQIEDPNEPGLWRAASIKRKNDFAPVDALKRGRELAERYFGDNPVPIGVTGKQNAAMEIAKLDGIDVDEGEIRGEAEGQAVRSVIETQRQRLAEQADQRAVERQAEMEREASGEDE